MKTLAEEWARYEEMVLPTTAGPTQRQETRRGFYAGAQALLSLIAAVGTDDISEDQGAQMIEARHQELLAFNAAVQAGHA